MFDRGEGSESYNYYTYHKMDVSLSFEKKFSKQYPRIVVILIDDLQLMEELYMLVFRKFMNGPTKWSRTPEISCAKNPSVNLGKTEICLS